MLDLTNDQTIPVNIPGIGAISGRNTIVLLGANGSGKSQLARQLVGSDGSRFISAQRRTHLSEHIQVFSKADAENNMRSHLHTAYANPTQQSNEIDILFSRLLGEQFERFSLDDQARRAGENRGVVTDTNLALLHAFWSQVFPGRTLELSTFKPTVKRVLEESGPSYAAGAMSDGERSSLYLAARVLTTTSGLLVIDEPELHFHSRLATAYWDGLETLRPDIRFVYATHDLPFALSRRSASIVIVKDRNSYQLAKIDDLPAWLLEDLLSAATLSVAARRFVFFEGEGLVGSAPKGEAARFFRAWFNGPDTVAIGVGNRDAVIAAVKSFRDSGLVTNASIIGIVDSDHYSDEQLAFLANDSSVWILKVHEFENLLVLPEVVRAIASHLGVKDDVWPAIRDRFVKKIESERGRIIGLRARTQFDELLRGVLQKQQLEGSSVDVQSKHVDALSHKNWGQEFSDIFLLSEKFAKKLAAGSDREILRLLPGKGLINEVVKSLGIRPDRYFDLIVQSLQERKEGALFELGCKLSSAFAELLPPRSIS